MNTIFLTSTQITQLQEGGSVRVGDVLLINVEDEDDEYE